jgi:hypothetical protein
MFSAGVQDMETCYVINVSMTENLPTEENMQRLFDMFSKVRKLDKDFYFSIDLTRAPLKEYICWVPKIFKEASIHGEPKCIHAKVDLPSSLSSHGLLKQGIELFGSLTRLDVAWK